ncbi:MAG: hypothetical protein DI538_17735 [Azospira oryzae]|nr:MAG: hypothetical protein DI538_17735 [Azospira oryzae]
MTMILIIRSEALFIFSLNNFAAQLYLKAQHMRTACFLLHFLLATTFVFSQNGGTIHGIIRDRQKQPVPYANVAIKSTSLATVSNEEGLFWIKDIPYGTHEVVISSIGYESLLKTITIQEKMQEVNFELADNVQQLNEVVVQTEKQSTLLEQKPIAVKSINIGEVITQNTLLTDITDRMAGVRIRRSSSLGEKSDISINGLRGNAVRVYVDGLPMEFLYPNFDLSTIPLSNINRIDVYKGVVPVDVGTDAMGGAINMTTEQSMTSHLRASYGNGSFNTHLADFEIGFGGKKNFFLTANGAYNYSDNNYSMKALVYETNKVEKVKRFHDAYQMAFAGLTMGVHSKPWADELRLTVNYATGFKELQNGARISTYAIGQAKYTSDNYAAILKYHKALLNDLLHISNNGGFSYQNLNFIDTTKNIYSWSGAIVGRGDGGEYAGVANTTTHYSNIVDRLSANYTITQDHVLTLSNIYATQRLTGKDHLTEEDERDYLAIPQHLTKNILGLQYDGRFVRKFSATAAVKRFDFILDGAENNTYLPVKKKDHFLGWNASIKYDINEQFYVKTSYERGFRIPYFEQFVGNGADILRNTGLMPESSDNLNFGMGYSAADTKPITVNTNLNAFYRKQYDVIFLGNTSVRRYENADEVKTIGLEGDLVAIYNQRWTWRNNITLLRQTFSHLKDPRNAFLEGTTFPNTPTFYANTEVSWQKTGFLQPLNQLRLYSYYQYVAPFNHIMIGQRDTYANSPSSFVPTQHRVDVGASYRFGKKHFTAALNIVNLLNAELYDNFLVPRAGINYNAKLIFEIKNLKQ